MDLGSYIELEFKKGNDLFRNVSSNNIIYLNTCRAGLFHAVRCYGVKKVWIAKYQCDVVSSCFYMFDNITKKQTTDKVNNLCYGYCSCFNSSK